MTVIDDNKICIVLAPLTDPPAHVISSIAAVINKSPYETGRLITGNIPGIVAYSDDMQTAERTARKLEDLGLIAYICPKSELHRPSQIFKVHTMEIKQDTILVRDRNNRSEIIEPDKVFLIIRGRLRSSILTEETTSKTKINVTATLLTGIPMVSRKKQTKQSTRSETDYFLKLYKYGEINNDIEFHQHDLDYSFLDTEMGSSSLTNFNAMFTKIKNFFPKAIIDERLVKSMDADAPPAGARKDIDINCRLIYLYYRHTGNAGPSL